MCACLAIPRCGSTTHLKITHRDCPLNPKRGGPDNPSASAAAPPSAPATQPTQVDTDADETPAAFPYPVGTKVAVAFDVGTFAGTIIEHYPGEDSCLVQFTDGDKGEYDAGQIEYAMQLHAREFPAEE